ncbi:MAG: C40 family peptidase [Fimbriimonas sp.]
MRSSMTLTTVTAALVVFAPAMATAKAPKAPAPKAPAPQKNAAGRVVLGKLGQATKTTSIYTSPTRRSRAYYQVKPKEYLVIRRTRTSGWVQVLMQTGQYGYAETAAVTQLPYEVTSNAPANKKTPRSTYLASRGGGAAVADYSLNFQGTPYVWGGNDPQRGIDCSGFVKKMYGTIGVNLPRTAAEQAMVGTPIYKLEDLRKGDRLYFWDKKRGKIGHTGIYLGDGNFVHSSSGRKGVATDYLGSERWLRILVGARR